MIYVAGRIVIAVPTIPERRHLWPTVEAAWMTHTCQPVAVIFSEAPGSWAAGLNDIWAQVRDEPPAVFVCGSDDMVPADGNWLPPLEHWLDRGRFPAPTVIDPRFTNYGGHLVSVDDGTPSEMSSFPVIAGAWCDEVFPLPEDLHYYADNLISVKLSRAARPCVAVPSSRIQHLWAAEGRGAGEGSEEQRMLVDTVRYTHALAELGIDRLTLPLGQRGPLA